MFSDKFGRMNAFLLIPPGLPVATLMESFLRANTAGKVLVVLLFIGSILAWSILVTKLLEYSRALRESRRFLSLYQKEPTPLSLYLKRVPFSGCPLFEMYKAGCNALSRIIELRRSETPDLFAGAPGKALPKLQPADLKAVGNVLNQQMDEAVMQLERHVVILATAVTAAPFIGLLGTVWGVMDAFGGLANQGGSATLSAVAPGVSGSLIATLVGLIVALPSLVGYNVLSSRIRILNAMMEHFTDAFVSDIERFGSAS